MRELGSPATFAGEPRIAEVLSYFLFTLPTVLLTEKLKEEIHSADIQRFVSLLLCRFVTDYRTISLNQMSREKLVSSMPWREIVGTANFKRDFLKVVDFLYYLRAEGYDMVTFKKVGDVAKF